MGHKKANIFPGNHLKSKDKKGIKVQCTITTKLFLLLLLKSTF